MLVLITTTITMEMLILINTTREMRSVFNCLLAALSSADLLFCIANLAITPVALGRCPLCLHSDHLKDIGGHHNNQDLDSDYFDDLGVDHNNDYLDGQTRPYGSIFARHSRGTQSHISLPQVLFIQHYQHHRHHLY